VSNVDERWCEFNDSRIKEFSTKSLESECFGGASDSDDYSTGGWFRSSMRENSKNAYLLVYERRFKEDIKLEFKD